MMKRRCGRRKMLLDIPMEPNDCVCSALGRLMGLEMDLFNTSGCSMKNCIYKRPEFKGDFIEYFRLGDKGKRE